MRERSIDRVNEMVEMEKLADYTCNPKYLSTWNKLMEQQRNFMVAINDTSAKMHFSSSDYRLIDVGYSRAYPMLVQQAFDLKMRLNAYWRIVLRRLVDSVGLHLVFSVQNLVNKEMISEVVNEMMGPNSGGMERLLKESPFVAAKREKLNKSIKMLKESKEVLYKIIDRIAEPGDSLSMVLKPCLISQISNILWKLLHSNFI